MKITWKSPSNIAIIKYWGKHGRQLPRNSSLSLTLKNAYSQTSLEYTPKTADGQISVSFKFEGKPNEKFEAKIVKFLESILDEFPFLVKYHLDIESMNSFPHSAGIASSASSMSALALCLCSMEQQIKITLPNQEHFFRRASHISRLGSGSASRSVYPHVAIWGQSPHIEEASDLYAIPYSNQVHEIFHSFHDDILLISRKEKSVSSTAGHQLMEGNPFADIRYAQANDNMKTLLAAMAAGDLETFGTIAEQEALMLHALMMTSKPSYILMEGNSIEAIKRVQAWRKETGTPLYFTLDAGPNLHLLYPHEVKTAVQDFVIDELALLCENGQWIPDEVSAGPMKM